MRLLEYESKEILKKYGVSVPPAQLISSSEGLEIEGPVVLKAQIPLGGRGKAGGIVQVTSQKEARERARELLSTTIREYLPKKLLVEEKADVVQELFMAITYDSLGKTPVAVFSQEGGVDIEELAARHPEKVRREPFSADGFRSIGPGRSSRMPVCRVERSWAWVPSSRHSPTSSSTTTRPSRRSIHWR